MPPEPQPQKPGWFSRLNPKQKRIAAALLVAGGLALMFLLSRRQTAADAAASDAAGADTSATDTGLSAADQSATGVPGAWDYGSVPQSPYYPGMVPPGQSGQIAKLTWQIALLRKLEQNERDRDKPGPPPREIGPPEVKPPPKPKPPPLGDPHGPPITRPPRPHPKPKPPPPPPAHHHIGRGRGGAAGPGGPASHGHGGRPAPPPRRH